MIKAKTLKVFAPNVVRAIKHSYKQQVDK